MLVPVTAAPGEVITVTVHNDGTHALLPFVLSDLINYLQQIVLLPFVQRGLLSHLHRSHHFVLPIVSPSLLNPSF